MSIKTTTQIESIASQLIGEKLNTISPTCEKEQEFSATQIALKLFPYLLETFESATAATKGVINSKYRRSVDVFGAHLKSEVLPQLSTATSSREMDTILSEVYTAYPSIKTIVKQTEKDFSDDDDNGVFALAIVGTLVAAVCIYAVGYAIGYALS